MAKEVNPAVQAQLQTILTKQASALVWLASAVNAPTMPVPAEYIDADDAPYTVDEEADRLARVTAKVNAIKAAAEAILVLPLLIET